MDQQPSAKAELFLSAIETTRKALESGTSSPQPQSDSTPAPVAVRVDPLLVDVIREMDQGGFVVAQDNEQGTDVIKEYLKCLQSLCSTTGGTWIDNNPDKAAGCYFGTKVGAAGYATLAWTCLPGGLIRAIFA